MTTDIVAVNLQVARQASLKPMAEVAEELHLSEHLLEPYGDTVAKVKLRALERRTTCWPR